MQPAHYGELYDRFQANVSRYDCGRICAPLNNGEPVCCTTSHAIPVVDKTEFQLLQTRSDLWHRFKPTDANSRKIVNELHKSCCAIECKGARSCERDNRTLACRAFPFYPYITKDDRLVGLGTYWIFEDRCWLISNMQVVERDFIQEFVAAYEYVFERDPEERQVMRGHSATHRRIFSRQDRIIPLIGRDGGFFKVMPRSGEIRPARITEFKKIGPYRSEKAYQRAVKEAGGALPEQPVMVAAAV
jgi:hypothetical protein